MAKYEFDRKNGKIISCELEGGEEVLEIPSEYDYTQVRILGESAFDYCEGVKRIIVPEGVTTIEEFSLNIRGLEVVDLPKTIKNVDEFAIDENVKINYKGDNKNDKNIKQ